MRLKNALLFPILLAGILPGCATRSIHHILADPGRYAHRDVSIQGERY